MNQKLTINTDGASRGNPGEASYGFLIKDDNGEIIFSEGQYIGINTNNFAEYTAVLKALEYIEVNKDNLEFSEITVVTDSQLVAQQLSGKYKIKSPTLKVIFNQIKILEMTLGTILYKNVPREQNKEADKLANLALDNR